MDAAEALTKLRAYLEKEGLKFTRQRQLITEVFFDPKYADEHPTVEDLYLRVRERDERIGYATVYRTLKVLADSDLASPSRLGDGQTRYEPEDEDHHDHLVCTECGAILEFEEERIETLQDKVAESFGFELSNHRMVLWGKPAGPDCAVEGCRRETAR